jgi:hypothetical protein
MPKIKVLSRNPDDYVRETKHDIHKMPRNYAPDVHPMAQAREYVRALNATKLERVFAKPFIASLDGHTGKRDTRTRAKDCIQTAYTVCAHIRVIFRLSCRDHTMVNCAYGTSPNNAAFAACRRTLATCAV